MGCFFYNNVLTTCKRMCLRPTSALCEWCNMLAGTLRYSEVLSSDLQKNILAALLRLGAVRRIKGYVGFDRAHIPAAFFSR